MSITETTPAAVDHPTPFAGHSINPMLAPGTNYRGKPDADVRYDLACADPDCPTRDGAGWCDLVNWLEEDPIEVYRGPEAPLAAGEILVWQEPVTNPPKGCAPYLWVWRYAGTDAP